MENHKVQQMKCGIVRIIYKCLTDNDELMTKMTDFKCVLALTFINKRLHRELNAKRCIYYLKYFPRLHLRFYLQKCEVFTVGLQWLKRQLYQLNQDKIPLIEMNCEGFEMEH